MKYVKRSLDVTESKKTLESQASNSLIEISSTSSMDQQSFPDYVRERIRVKRKIVTITPDQSYNGSIKYKKQRSLHKSMVLKDILACALEDHETLSTRLEYAMKLWKEIRQINSATLRKFVLSEEELIKQLSHQILYEPYFPLQQFFYMSLSGMYCAFHTPQTSENAFEMQRISRKLDLRVVSRLPTMVPMDWTNPTLSRRIINELNEDTKTCQTFRVQNCWISKSGQDALHRLVTDRWVDFGDVTASLYSTHKGETFVVNFPYSCIENVQVDKARFRVYIQMQHIIGLENINLVVFFIRPPQFACFVKAVKAITPIKHFDVSPVKINSLEHDGRSNNFNDALFSNDNIPDNTESSSQNSTSPSESDERIVTTIFKNVSPIMPNTYPHDLDFQYINSENCYDEVITTKHFVSYSNRLKQSMEIITQNILLAESAIRFEHDVEESISKLTHILSRISTLNINWSRELSHRAYCIRTSNHELQQLRLLFLPHFECRAQHRLSNLIKNTQNLQHTTIKYTESTTREQNFRHHQNLRWWQCWTLRCSRALINVTPLGLLFVLHTIQEDIGEE